MQPTEICASCFVLLTIEEIQWRREASDEQLGFNFVLQCGKTVEVIGQSPYLHANSGELQFAIKIWSLGKQNLSCLVFLQCSFGQHKLELGSIQQKMSPRSFQALLHNLQRFYLKLGQRKFPSSALSSLQDSQRKFQHQNPWRGPMRMLQTERRTSCSQLWLALLLKQHILENHEQIWSWGSKNNVDLWHALLHGSQELIEWRLPQSLQMLSTPQASLFQTQ